MQGTKYKHSTILRKFDDLKRGESYKEKPIHLENNNPFHKVPQLKKGNSVVEIA